MQILFHLGAHCTDGGLLVRSILRNRETLAKEGIVVPGPGRYRELLGEVSTTLRGDSASTDTEDMLLDAIRDDDSAERIILSNENFLCRGNVVLGEDRLYPKAHKSAWLSRCFPHHQPEFAIAMRNPATLLPDLLARISSDPDERLKALEDVSLGDLLWSDVIARIAKANPDARIVTWCHEDTPFIWPEIMRELTGHDPYIKLDGSFDMLEQIISPEGMKRLTEFLGTRDVQNESRRRSAIAAFLEAHALQSEIEEEIDLPGWTDETVEDLTELYEEDVVRVGKMPGVMLIEP